MFDEEDFLLLEKKSFTVIGEDIKRMENKMPLLIHSTLSYKVKINQELLTKLKNDHGIINMTRMISKKEEQFGVSSKKNFTTIKIEVSNEMQWKKLLTNGLQIDVGQPCVTNYWPREPVFCTNCLNYGHYKDICDSITLSCETCTKEITLELVSHECAQYCKYCSNNKHITNAKDCPKYINEKTWKNRAYPKLAALLDIKKSKYNTRRTRDNVKQNESTNDTYKLEFENKLKALETQIRENRQELFEFKEEQRETNDKIKKEMRSKHKLFKGTDMKLGVMFEKMFEKEKGVIEDMKKKISNLESSTSSLEDMENDENKDGDDVEDDE
jgi:hypothetical protein